MKDSLPTRCAALAKAFEAARKFADTPRPSGWLVFIGPYGCGKTHLAAAIANYRASMGYSTLFIFVPDLLDHLRATFNPNSTVRYDKRFEEVRSAPLLILDSLDSQTMTPWVKEKLYQIFNHRYIAELPTVITTAERLEDMDNRLRSRLMDTRLTTVYGITAPAFSGKETKGRASPRSRKS
jgi:DNA replication protein DnaC